MCYAYKLVMFVGLVSPNWQIYHIFPLNNIQYVPIDILVYNIQHVPITKYDGNTFMGTY